MALNGRKTTYTATDFERYYNGKMPAAERHALEKSALDDPFLADALDGYAHTNTPAADLVFLKQALQKKQSKVAPVFWMQQRNYMKLAAMIVLLAGFGWLTFRLTNTNKTDIALLQKDTSNTNQRISEKATTDSIATAPEEKLQPDTNTQTTAKRSTKKEEQGTETDVTVSNQGFSKTHNDAVPESKNVSASRRAPDVFKARVVDPNQNAVMGARISTSQHKTLATTDTTGSFLVSSPDSSLSITINSAGFQQQQAVLNPSQRETTLVMQPAIAATAKRKTPTAQNRIRLEGATPLYGWQPIESYLDSTAVPLYENTKTGSNAVVLSFAVTTDGKAVNIMIDKPLCPACDSTAVQLIEYSTRWKMLTPTKRAKAYIRF